MKNPKVFIIVLHYKNWDDTNKCLKSLKGLDYDNFETIVIDNDKENLGFAKGMNIGINQALKKKTDYVLLLNNDTVVEPGFLKKLIKVGESDKKIGILGPVIYEYPSTRLPARQAGSGQAKIHFAGGKINWLYTKGIHITELKVNPSSTESRRGRESQKLKVVDYITGCCMLVKREVIEKIGLMPKDYFLYFEDVDWCLKARRAGYKCVLVTSGKIWHKPSSSTIEGSFSYIYYHTRNGLLMAKKNALFFIKILAYLQSFWVFGKQVIKLIIFPKRKIWAKAIMKGIGDFHRRKYGKSEVEPPKIK